MVLAYILALLQPPIYPQSSGQLRYFFGHLAKLSKVQFAVEKVVPSL